MSVDVTDPTLEQEAGPGTDAHEPHVAAHELPATDPFRTCVAAFLASGAAAWMAAGAFHGALPKLIAFIGPLLGAGVVAASFRARRPSLLQYLALPAALVVGAAFVLPDATGGTANLPGLIAEAVRAGGVAQPPIPFDPGWRFILIVLPAVVSAAGASLATSLERPRLAIFLPLPVIFGAALVQPPEGTLPTIAVALVLFVASLAVAYGVELAREGATSGSFEIRRLGRGAVVLGLLVAILFALSRAAFLFPDVDRDQEIPPERPEVQPPQEDRLLFTVEADRPGPWRLGVLDVYDGEGWLLPPYATDRFIDLDEEGTLERGSTGPRAAGERERATFEIADVEGHVLPTAAGAVEVSRHTEFALWFDPRTQMLRLPESRARQGMRYTVTSAALPEAEVLAEAPSPPEEIRETFVEGMPPAPSEVVILLDEAPDDDPFSRLQYVRNAFYEEVVAAGAGEPVDVPPSRVAEMLRGDQATPFEITAAEALLARWAGVPARVGYGYHLGDDEADGDRWEVRPRHGSTWLEVYFHGHGWVPVVGTPPEAQASLSPEDQRDEPEILPTDDLALVVYVPVRLESLQLLFTLVRYWIAVTAPFVAGLALLWAAYPGAVKAARRVRRRRWAAREGLTARIAVAYAELRDAAVDLNIGHGEDTPLEFVDAVDPDPEHTELAWAVTRGIWGDLARDLQPADAEAVEELAASVTRRVRRAQPAMSRIIAIGSRTSLREPYTEEIPNLWPRLRITERITDGVRWVRSLSPLRRAFPLGGVLLAIALVVGACATVWPAGVQRAVPADEPVTGEPVLPESVAPGTMDGLRFQRETDAERAYAQAGPSGLIAEGRVFTVREDGDVLGSLQVGAFKPGHGATYEELERGVRRSVGAGDFELTRIGDERIWVQEEGELTLFLWFPPRMEYFEVFVARADFEGAGRTFAGILAHQRGEEADDALHDVLPGLVDPRRGAPE